MLPSQLTNTSTPPRLGPLSSGFTFCRSNLPHRLSGPTTVDENAEAFIPSRLVRLGQRRQTYERLSTQPARDACRNSLAGFVIWQNGSKVIGKGVTNRWDNRRRISGSYRRAFLLLVVHCNATEFLALRVLATRSDDAALAISRDHNATTSDIIVGFSDVEP